MVRKPTSGDSEQREREAERARKQSQLSSSSGNLENENQPERSKTRKHGSAASPTQGSPEGESAHGALERADIDQESR